ncbi:protein UL87 [Equid gammaherpesvirus 2]|uniref:Protein UL87 n=1 Tax=Equid gammaherpesvirus 2 TaxID=12657 RepID=A0A0B4Q5X4_9GAMA|nr:protein UL87 [Equid gammaherpesvirus 2]
MASPSSLLFGEAVILPVYDLDAQQQQRCAKGCRMEARELLSLQIDIFSCLALNRSLGGVTANLDALDAALRPEPIFYTCRAVRRLLLGACWYPVVVENEEGEGEGEREVDEAAAKEEPGNSRIGTVPGEAYEGAGLIITSDGMYINKKIQTHSYLHTIYSLESTDNAREEWRCRARAVFCHSLSLTLINPQLMFRIISRYLSINQFEECFSSFVEGVARDRALRATCTRNYFALLGHLKSPAPPLYSPPASSARARELHAHGVLSFVADWPDLEALAPLRAKVAENLVAFPQTLASLCALPYCREVSLEAEGFHENQALVSMAMPYLKVAVYKKDPGARPGRVVAREGGGVERWYVYPPRMAVYRITMCLAAMGPGARHVPSEAPRPSSEGPGLPHALVSLLNRGKYAPRETRATMTLPLGLREEALFEPGERRRPLADSFAPVSSLSVHGFGINVFNTNMVINTKIACDPRGARYRTVMDIPRLTNNFVIRKYSVKEPSFTVSVFYSDAACASGTAINMNISGDYLSFLYAVGNLKCFMPVRTVFPISVANWNSTLDLQGLENQQLVRRGRSDVFWTTNFPSAVSTQRGSNVSWFKAATATISKVHGPGLVARVYSETAPILTNPRARLNLVKNAIFSTVETRNKAQIQTIHKRFLECLYECASFGRLDVRAVLRLARGGYFDFSKRIISHTKNKHECAVLGYKKCNLIPKILCDKKKVRLDELGRNANFMTFLSSVAHRNRKLKNRMLRHISRTMGLSWKLHIHKN